MGNDLLDKNKVILGLSGGVDSTTAALLLKKTGKDVTGLYFDVTLNDISENEDYLRAKKAAEKLDIPLIYRNVSGIFRDKVISNFCSEYIAGRTPNPCIICNPEVKFRVLLDAADEEGAYYIATGHYAGIENGCRISRARNLKKDQSYMLYRLDENIVKRLLLPLYDVEDKDDARGLLEENELFEIAEARDSQEICFIDDEHTYRDFLKAAEKEGLCSRVPDDPGDYVDESGNVIGKHSGIINYTIGQRKGLGQTFGKPMFVKAIDTISNRITLCENSGLFSREIYSTGNFFIGEYPKEGEKLDVYAKIRYAAVPAHAVVEKLSEDHLKITFDEPQRAAAPGQSAVFYDENGIVLGGGFIRTGI